MSSTYSLSGWSCKDNTSKSELIRSQLQEIINKIISNETLLRILSNDYKSRPSYLCVEITSKTHRYGGEAGQVYLWQDLIIRSNKLLLRKTYLYKNSYEYEVSLARAIEFFGRKEIINSLNELMDSAQIDVISRLKEAEKMVETAKENLRSIAEISLGLPK